MHVLIIDPMFNSPGMHDDDGAFELGAEKLAKTIGPNRAERASFDNRNGYPTRLHDVEAAILHTDHVDVFIEVSHSTHVRLQSGIDRSNLPGVLKSFRSGPPSLAILFACSAASEPFASSVAEQMAGLGVECIAHSTVGHAYFNPYLVHVRPPEVGKRPFPERRYIVGPGTPHWRSWVADIKRGGWLDLVLFCIADVKALATPHGMFKRDAEGFITWQP